jgi:hypothetical protein
MKEARKNEEETKELRNEEGQEAKEEGGKSVDREGRNDRANAG